MLLWRLLVVVALAAGGWGMAGGAMVLGGAVVAPVLAVAGIAYAIHGSKALDKARDIRYEKLTKLLQKWRLHKSSYCESNLMYNRIYNELTKIYSVFNLYFEKLKEINQILKRG